MLGRGERAVSVGFVTGSTSDLAPSTTISGTGNRANFLGGPPEWLSPLAPGYDEFRDDLWEKVGLLGQPPHKPRWWPDRGPVWDAVARLHGKEGQLGLLVVEAKSHALELRSTCAAQDEDSVGRINAALTETKRCLGVSDLVDWHAPHYQMANRLAFLYYLRQRSGIPAWLVFVYFTGDRFCSGESEVIGALSEEEWEPIIRTAHKPISTESG